MSTRSDIIVQLAAGNWARIYCHSDGYLSHNGRLLVEHYNSGERAAALIGLGDLSCLAETIGKKHNFDWRTALYDKYKSDTGACDYERMHDSNEYKRYSRMCLAYGRDRGEKDTAAAMFESLPAAWPEADTWTEYAYVWSREHGCPEGKWYLGNPNEGSQLLRPLDEAVAINAVFEPLTARHEDSSPGFGVVRTWTGALLIFRRETDEERAIPMTAAKFEKWISKRPHAERKYGSFTGDSETCAERRLSRLWESLA